VTSASVEPPLNVAVLIPAYKPAEQMLELLEALSDSPVARIIVVNDGSPPQYQTIFDQVQSIPKVHLLVHDHNQGKGAALKTGLRYLSSLSEPSESVITADADGQHAVTDILLVARQTLERPQALILGGRRFDKDVPWKSMAGNTITRWIMRLFFGIQIYDSQTGLRGIPAGLVPMFLEIPYDRFEYEQEMLMVCSRRGIPVHEVTIRTIYFNQNRATHFNPLKDSVRVYFILFRFRIAWLITWLLDYYLFAQAIHFSPGILLPTVIARIGAVLLIYPFITYLVFAPRGQTSLSNSKAYFRRFGLLALSLSLVSALALSLLSVQADRSLLENKVIVEILILLLFSLLPTGLKRAILPA
jgi:glycosyltransferase involved in cell wall biosynthesis